MVQSNLAWRESGRELPFAHLLAALATLGRVPPVLDRLVRTFVKQSVKARLEHSPNHFVNWPLASLIGIVQIPPLPPFAPTFFIRAISIIRLFFLKLVITLS